MHEGIGRAVVLLLVRPAELARQLVDDVRVAGSQAEDDRAVFLADFDRQARTLECRDGSFASFAF